MVLRTKSSTYHRLRSTAMAGSASGTTRSLHPLACKSSPALRKEQHLQWLTKYRYIFSLPYTKFVACDVLRHREFNSIALAVLAVFALVTRRRLGPLLANPKVVRSSFGDDNYAIHTAVNIALCPVVFFFSGLYYTDVASTAVVLAAFMHSLDRMSVVTCSLWSDVTSILLGVLALCMRQTNVFWVVVCFGALEAVHAVETLPLSGARKPDSSGLIEQIKYHTQRYSVGHVHDPPLDSTWPDGK